MMRPHSKRIFCGRWCASPYYFSGIRGELIFPAANCAGYNENESLLPISRPPASPGNVALPLSEPAGDSDGIFIDGPGGEGDEEGSADTDADADSSVVHYQLLLKFLTDQFYKMAKEKQ